MQTLSLGDTLALYINRTDLESLGLTQSDADLAALARRALAERGAAGSDGIALEIYSSAAAGELLLFCRPLAREVVAFTSLAAAIEAAKRLAPVRGSLHGSDPCVRDGSQPAASAHAPDTNRGEAAQHRAVAHAEAADAASAHLHLTDTSVWLLTLRASPSRARLLAAVAAEFGAPAEASEAYLAEHARLIIEHNAVELLAQL